MLINFNHLKTFYNALVHKMKSFRGNWEQNDPTAEDYIKNRPFYTDEPNEVLYVNNLTRYEYENYPTLPCNFVPGERYIVIWNGKRYDNVVCISDGSYNILGSYDSSYPFYIDDDGGDCLYISADGDFTVSIYIDKTVIHKIDSKYLPDGFGMPDLPDNIVTTDNLGEVLPSNLVTSDNIVDNLPNNVITADELADVATTGDYADLENTPTDLTAYNNLILPESFSGYHFILNGSASCKDSKEAIIPVYRKNSSVFGTVHTADGVHWSYHSFNPPSGVPSNVTPEDMDSGELFYPGSGYKDTSILIADGYVAYHTPEDTGWDLQDFPITLTNGSTWNTVCCGNKVIALSGPTKTGRGSNTIPSSVAAVCNGFDDTTSTYVWTETAMPEEALWSNAVFGKLNGTNTFVAISYGTTAAYSTDGITWMATQMPIDASWRWIACNDKACVAVSLEGDAAYTSDGVQWKVIASDIKPFAGPISVSNNYFVSLSADEGVVHSRYSITSYGSTWEESTHILPKSFKGCSILQAVPSRSLLMAFDSSSKYIMSNDKGITWTSGALTINNQLENENIANALVSYIMTDDNIPPSIARVGDSYTKEESDARYAIATTDKGTIESRLAAIEEKLGL